MNTLRLSVAAAVVAIVCACSNPQGDWQKAEAENTEASYKAFLDKYPQGEWAQKAQAQLDTIKDTREWENAQTADALDGYNNYLAAHPTGAHIGEARQRITELERDAAWTAAQQAGSKEAYDEFLARFPDAPQADQARSAIAALNPPPPPPKPEKPAAKGKAAATVAQGKVRERSKPAAKASAAKGARKAARKGGAKASSGSGSYRVQLGAFSSMDKAQTEVRRAEERFHGIVGSLSIQQPSGTDHLYRVRSSGMSQAAAKSTCQQIKSSGQACVVVSR